MPNQKKDTPMQITVRLYRQHDMDLVGLYRTKDFKFQRHMKNALKHMLRARITASIIQGMKISGKDMSRKLYRCISI